MDKLHSKLATVDSRFGSTSGYSESDFHTAAVAVGWDSMDSNSPSMEDLWF